MVNPRSIATLIYLTAAVGSHCQIVAAAAAGRPSFVVGQQQQQLAQKQDAETSFLRRSLSQNDNDIRNLGNEGITFVNTNDIQLRGAAVARSESNTNQAERMMQQEEGTENEEVNNNEHGSDNNMQEDNEEEPSTWTEEGASTLLEEGEDLIGEEETERNPIDKVNAADEGSVVEAEDLEDSGVIAPLGGNNEENPNDEEKGSNEENLSDEDIVPYEGGDINDFTTGGGLEIQASETEPGDEQTESETEPGDNDSNNDGETEPGDIALTESETEPGDNDGEDELVGTVQTVEGQDITETLSGESETPGVDSTTTEGSPSEVIPGENTEDALTPETTATEATTTTTVSTTALPDNTEGSNTDDEWNENDDGTIDKTDDTPWPGDATETTITEPTTNNDFVWTDDEKGGNGGGSSSTNMQEKYDIPEVIKEEERRVRFLSASGVIFAIFAMIFTAYQMSENPDGFYAAMCRFCITVLVCIFRIVLSPCKGVFGYSNRHSHYGHVPVSTLDYGYRDPAVELQLQ